MKIKAFLIAFLFIPLAVYGATAEELQAQINALLAQIQALQAQLSIAQGSQECSFTRDLTIGVIGDDVKCLQQYLNSAGHTVASSGAGSPGNETTYFGSLTRAGVSKWQAANEVSPTAGYFGPLSRAKYDSLAAGALIIPTAPETPVSEPPAETPVATTSVSEVAAPTEPAPEETLPNPFVSSLKIEIIYPSLTLSSYGYKTLNGLRFSASEKIAITRIRFKNNGTFNDVYIKDLELLDAADTILAKVENLTNQSVEFKMTPDAAKKNKGLVVSGNDYYIAATLLTPSYGEEKPKIRLDIESVSDISAFDYDDLTRVADISETVSFPIQGPTISAF